MSIKIPIRLADLYGQDLAGWQITPCYFLQLEHTLMGTFPAINTQSGDPIIVRNKQDLELVWNQLERRPAKVSSILAIAHSENGVMFSLEPITGSDQEALRFLSTEQIESLCQTEGSVRWQPGLYQLSDGPVEDPVFTV